MPTTNFLSDITCGAKFYRADLHIHSFGASFDVTDPTATVDNIILTAAAENLSMIAITDHNEIVNVRAAVEAGVSAGLLVIPGVELSTPEGHLLCYAPSIEHLERFFHRLDIADRGTKDCRCAMGMKQCLDQIGVEGGFGVIAHIESRGSFEEKLPTSTPSKLDILCHNHLLAIEVTNAECPIKYNSEDENCERLQIANTRIKRRQLGSQQILARVLNSDAHTIKAIGRNSQSNRRITRYKMETPSFNGLRIALEEADTRVRIEDEIPQAVAIIEGVSFDGGFLDGQTIHFSKNLTCIIGGRGSGKSTTFEALRLVGGEITTEGSVIDSDVWPDFVSLYYRDETDGQHVLSRSKGGSVENSVNSGAGLTSFPLESYRQGETHVITQKAQTDPLTLLNFLDRLIDIETAINFEDNARTVLNDLWPKIEIAQQNVNKIPDVSKRLVHKEQQLERLKKERGEEVIALQQKLESERRTRVFISSELAKLSEATTNTSIEEIVLAIKNVVTGSSENPVEPEGGQILTATVEYQTRVSGVTATLQQTTATYSESIKQKIQDWQNRDTTATANIEAKKQELLAAGIRLDMPFIQQLVTEVANSKEQLKVLQTWEPHLVDLKKQYESAIEARWTEREKVSETRVLFAQKATDSLKNSVSDIFVSLKYTKNSLSPDADRIIIETMGWRTTQQLKSKALTVGLTLPVLLNCLRRSNIEPIKSIKGEGEQRIFSDSEAQIILERLSSLEIKAQLEVIAVYDKPRLTVTKKVSDPLGQTQYIPRDFSKLSLGQQQSVLLSLMLTSESKTPLIIDQPEDNLDSEFIYKTLVPAIRRVKERRQVIIVTHNANIAVLGDAEQIVVLKATNEKTHIMTRASIDEPKTREIACTILEGAREAFVRRSNIYGDNKTPNLSIVTSGIQ
jgi:ABC-type cobalamin/Fe3+-siderophores transport system ATPase subunit